MSLWSRLLGCLAITGIALMTVASAQEKDKKDKKEDKEEKKEIKKADKEPVEEKVVYGLIIEGKLKRFASESTKEFVVEVMLPDPKKIYNFNVWQAEQQRHIAGAGDNFAERQRRLYAYQKELARKKSIPSEMMTAKDIEVRAAEKIKIRSLYPPQEYTDKGDLKKWTAKELVLLKGKSKLPGYPSEYDTLRQNMYLQVYLAKVEAPKGGIAKKKLDDDGELGSAKPEVVMVVIAGMEMR